MQVTSLLSLGLFALSVAGVYVWLYQWKWAETPASCASFTEEEARRLEAFDAYLTTQAVQVEIKAILLDLLQNEGFEKEELPWLEKISIRLSADWYSKAAYAPAREVLHAFLSTGNAQEDMVNLAYLALKKQDIPLFKLFVEKSVAVDEPLERELLLFSIPGQETMPVAQRLELLDFLLSKGVQLTGKMSSFRFLEVMERAIRYTDDERGELLDWFLRHGYQVDATAVASMLLQQPQSVLPMWKKLVEDGVLPPPPQNLAPALSGTALQLAAQNEYASPETVRWLLALGHAVQVPSPPQGPSSGQGTPPQQPLDACLSAMQYVTAGINEEFDARLRRHLEVLDILLQHGAVPTEQSRMILPIDADSRQQVVELMQRHGHYIMAGDNPCNACCEPE